MNKHYHMLPCCLHCSAIHSAILLHSAYSHSPSQPCSVTQPCSVALSAIQPHPAIHSTILPYVLPYSQPYYLIRVTSLNVAYLGGSRDSSHSSSLLRGERDSDLQRWL